MAHKNKALMRYYEIINHTADIGIKVYGKDLAELFTNAAQAMFEIMLESPGIKSRFQKVKQERFILNKKGQDITDVFVAWLSELLYLFSTQGLVLQKADIRKLDSNIIQAELIGHVFNPDTEHIKTEIKAVTYHGLEIISTERGYQAVVIFDV